MKLSNNQRKKQAAAKHNAQRNSLSYTESNPSPVEVSDDERKAIALQIEQADKLDTGERHRRMYEIADSNPLKGKKNGCCNVTQCQKPDSAVHFNNGTHAWYCRSCALDIHHANRFDEFRLFDDIS